MELETIIFCGQCQQAINSTEGSVCFKIPGKESYQFFHYRFRVGDCWEGHIEGANKTLARGRTSKTSDLPTGAGPTLSFLRRLQTWQRKRG